MTHALNTANNGKGCSEDGTGRGVPTIAQTVALRGREGGATAELGGDVATALRASSGGGDKPHVLTAAAFAQNSRDEVRLVGGDGSMVGALAAQPGMKQTSYVMTVHGTQDPIHSRHTAHALGRNSGQENAVVCGIQNATRGKSQNGLGVAPPTEPMYTLDQASQHGVCTQIDLAVRRLTPVECERLQGFPDNWTAVPFRNKDIAADGNRYKAIGNSMAVPVMWWIGERIAQSMLKAATGRV